MKAEADRHDRDGGVAGGEGGRGEEGVAAVVAGSRENADVRGRDRSPELGQEIERARGDRGDRQRDLDALGLRVSEEEELEGLDYGEHGMHAYDFGGASSVSLGGGRPAAPAAGVATRSLATENG